jgi:putative transposase
MPLMTATPIVVSAEERTQLEFLVRAHSTPQQLAMRGRVVLLAADNVGVREAARRLGIWPKTVRTWRKRWNDTSAVASLGIRLADAPRSGVTPTFTAEQICAIVALACMPPASVGVPITHWSQSELARQAVERGIVSGISHSSVGRFLKRIGDSAASGARLADAEVRSAV